MNIVRNLALLYLPSAFIALASDASGEHGGGDPHLTNKIINFAILAAGLGYVVVKTLVPALKGQQRDILAKLNQASKRAEEAAAQAAEMDQKLAGLSAEVQAIRDAAHREMQAEAARIEKETADQIEKIRHASDAELASAVKAARQELKAYSAQLAVDLARNKIAASLDDAAQARLISVFAGQLSAGPDGKN